MDLSEKFRKLHTYRAATSHSLNHAVFIIRLTINGTIIVFCIKYHFRLATKAVNLSGNNLI